MFLFCFRCISAMTDMYPAVPLPSENHNHYLKAFCQWILLYDNTDRSSCKGSIQKNEQYFPEGQYRKRKPEKVTSIRDKRFPIVIYTFVEMQLTVTSLNKYVRLQNYLRLHKKRKRKVRITWQNYKVSRIFGIKSKIERRNKRFLWIIRSTKESGKFAFATWSCPLLKY